MSSSVSPRKQLGANLTAIMRERRLSTKRLAELSGVSSSAIATVMHAQVSAGIDNVVAIADALGISLEELVRGSPAE